jgi:pullulanase
MSLRSSMLAAAAALGCAFAAAAQEPPLSPAERFAPGVAPTPLLRFFAPTATQVHVAGSWSGWTNRAPMQTQGGEWLLDVRTLPVEEGRHEFKFIIDGAWEPGDNRALFVNGQRLLERPPDVILNAMLESANEIRVYLREPPRNPAAVKARLGKDNPIAKILQASGRESGRDRGCAVAGPMLCFLFDEAVQGVALEPGAHLSVAGNFNGWDASGGGRGQWRLKDDDNDNVWELCLPLDGLKRPPQDPDFLFRFTLNGSQWLNAPPTANPRDDGNGNMNLVALTNAPGGTVLKLIPEKPVDLTQPLDLAIDGLADRRARVTVKPGKALDAVVSTRPLGALLDKARGCTTYRLFAPRAQSVHLCLYDTPAYEVQKPKPKRIPPAERYRMWRHPADGTWEITVLGLDIGRYYSFNVAGPGGEGEGFQPDAQVGDPYAVAAAHAHNNGIVLDRDATNEWFRGWTDAAWKTPALEDLAIYESHVRDMTVHPSSKVPPALRGTYRGLLASLGTGTGLDHLRDLGINAIELLPTAEFENGERAHNWGYNTVFYFAPEAGYATEPLKGSQFYEFKQMVNDLHTNGFAVILDVVYNHVGGPNVFSLIDRKYFFRMTPDFQFLNFSGCGNDVRSEAPMMRRLIVDNVLYWLKEHRVDGFRFDLGELIDMDTMREVERAARAVKPDVILISEPWSFRGENKHQLRDTTWSAWNNDFRYAAKDFARGRADRTWFGKTMMGSVDIWAQRPAQAINYVESHDDYALVDELSLRPDKNGNEIDPMEVGMNKIAATMLFTSLGVPMLNAGQDFMRSKFGIHNSYNKGDAVNALRWTDRERPAAAEALAYYRGLIQLRASPEGRSFRLNRRPPEGYYQWLLPDENRALGFLVNGRRELPGRPFIVLANTHTDPVPFAFKLPPGRWRVIADGKRIDAAGVAGYEMLTGPRETTIKVPGLRTMIMMGDG